MAGGAAGLHCEAEHLAPVQLRGLRRRKRGRNDDPAVVQLHIMMRIVVEVGGNPGGDVADIGGALLQIFILHAVKDRGKTLRSFKERIFGSDMLTLDPFFNFIQQRPVVDQHNVGFKDIGVARIEPVAHLILKFDQLLAGFHQCGNETGQLSVDFIIGNLVRIGLLQMVGAAHPRHPADRNPGRYRNRLNRLCW